MDFRPIFTSFETGNNYPVIVVYVIAIVLTTNISITFMCYPLFETVHAFDTSVPDRIKRNGYPVETFSNVITEDGYLLTVFRIPCGNPCINGTVNKPVVFLMHGLFGSSNDYVVMGPERSLVYLLADRGYDVWVGNARGTQYSRKHTVLNPEVDSEYWDFSWHEIGYYDLPAILKIIKTVTKTAKVSYLGTSMGTTAFFVLTSDRPEYNSDFSVMVAMAPAVYLDHLKSPLIRILAKVSELLNLLTLLLNFNQIPPLGFHSLIELGIQFFCAGNSAFIDLCENIISTVLGFSIDYQNKNSSVIIFQNGFSTVSRRQLLHYAQLINSREFRHFDFGATRNVEKYRRLKPPTYNLGKVSVPVNIFYSEGDWLCTPQDIEKLCKELPNCESLYKPAMGIFNHVDFLFSSNVVSNVYTKLFEVLDNYNGN